jgi:hypothetical protein
VAVPSGRAARPRVPPADFKFTFGWLLCLFPSPLVIRHS